MVPSGGDVRRGARAGGGGGARDGEGWGGRSENQNLLAADHGFDEYAAYGVLVVFVAEPGEYARRWNATRFSHPFAHSESSPSSVQ